MQVQVKLMGALKAHAPEGGTVELSDGASVDDLLSALGIAAEQVQVVMVNDRPRPDRSQLLADDDAVTVLAPVGGG